MFSIEYLIYAVICVGVFTIYMAVMNLLRSDRFSARVGSVGGFADDSEPVRLRSVGDVIEKIASLFTVGEQERKERGKQLMAAGIQSPYAMSCIVVYTRIVQPLLLLLALLVWAKLLTSGGVTKWALFKTIVLSMLLYTAARSGVDIYIRRKRKQRQRILLRYFPEVLDLLLVCIESGLGLDAALARASREMDVIHPLVVSELDRTRLELTLLADRVQALQNLADRADIVPFRALVAALIQTERFGTSLVDTLRVLAEDQRVTRLLETENKVARIPALVTIPLILCILPSFVIILIGPPLVGLIDGKNNYVTGPAQSGQKKPPAKPKPPLVKPAENGGENKKP